MSAEMAAPGAEDLDLAPEEIIVAVLDTGIDPQHPDIADHLVPGATFVSGTTSTVDDHGHGTEVAAVIERTVGELSSVRRVGQVWIMPVKVANSKGHTDDLEVAEGIRWAADNGARIINVSLGTEDIPEMRSAVQYAYRRGALVVAAAGWTTAPAYPADYPHVLAATGNATHAQARRRQWRMRDPVVAPSSGVMVRGRDGRLYDVAGFTSIAAARVSGLAALLLSVHPNLGADQVRQAIEDGSDCGPGRFRWGSARARGPINRERSLRLVEGMAASRSTCLGIAKK